MSVRTFSVPDRHDIVRRVTPKLKDGDILIRLSDTKGPFGLPFSALVASLSNSSWSHAAIVYFRGAEPYVFEVSDRGTLEYRLIDWLDFCVGGRFEVYRYHLITDTQRAAVRQAVMLELQADRDYDFTYDNPEALYCVESVVQVYARAGITLMEPMLFKDILGPVAYVAFRAGNSVVKRASGKGFDLAVPVYFVGNEVKGLLASPLLERVLSSAG